MGVKSTIEMYGWLWYEMNTAGRFLLFPVLCLGFPVVLIVAASFRESCVQEKTTTKDVYVDQIREQELGASDVAALDLGILKRTVGFHLDKWPEILREIEQWKAWDQIDDGQLQRDEGLHALYVDNYINDMIPRKYLRTWNLPDSVCMRFQTYLCCNPHHIRGLYQAHGSVWVHHLSDNDKELYRKYVDLVKQK